MRCRKCGERAVINMRYHRLALCEEHYIEWFHKQTDKAITKQKMFTPDDRVLVAVSGGKDSLALWEVLLELGYKADGLYIDLGIEHEEIAYSERSKEKAQQFASRYPEAKLLIVDIPGTYGENIIQVAQRRKRHERPCSICGLVKRHEMNRIALEEGYDVLATGHNLDDEAAVLFGNVLRWKSGYLVRQSPVLPADGEGLARKVKPFFQFYERETAAYTLLREIDYIYDECPYAKGATSIEYKNQLTEMEHETPGTKLHFYTEFLRAKKEGLFCYEEAEKPEMHPCEQCGQPTIAEGLCSFCRLWER